MLFRVLTLTFCALGFSLTSHAQPFAIWSGTDLNDIRSGQFMNGPQGRLVRIDLRTPGIEPPIASQECGAAVVFVHGAAASMGDFRVVSERLRRVPVEQYFFDYDESGRETSLNAQDLGNALMQFRLWQHDRTCRVVVIAHSMGGLVARAALNVLTGTPASRLGTVEVITVDTPWHGYTGPSDQGLNALMMLFAMPFVPNGFRELRARSNFFQNLNAGQLPTHLRYRIYFAADGAQVVDYSEFPNSTIVDYILSRYQENPRSQVVANPQVRNLWDAMVSSAQFPDFDHMLQRYIHRRQLSVETVTLALEQTFSHFSGDHSGVLDDSWDFAEFVSYEVARIIEDDTSR
jgi:pimeloyl-ACP methyl ester carboxylesterase